MTRGFPLISTLIVLLAALAMVRLGFWQLDRRAEKAALLAHYAANQARPPVALAALRPVDDGALYRRVRADCPAPAGWRAESGRDDRGTPGWRHIARCSPQAGMPALLVDMGTSGTADPPRWPGGTVEGLLARAPDQTPLVARLFAPRRSFAPMIVSATPAPGLRPTATPDPGEVANNHLAYAVQWFAFAAIALVIYAILLWRRRRAVAPVDPHR